MLFHLLPTPLCDFVCLFLNHSCRVSDKNLASFCHKDSKGIFSSSPFPSDPVAISVPPKMLLLYFTGCPCPLLLLLGSLPCLPADSLRVHGVSPGPSRLPGTKQALAKCVPNWLNFSAFQLSPPKVMHPTQISLHSAPEAYMINWEEKSFLRGGGWIFFF